MSFDKITLKLHNEVVTS